jgi:hypothetical protein
MKKRIIRFCYRKIIDASSEKAWDKLVFESSYKEFQMQSQFYNQEKKYDSFAELLINVPASEKLHFLVSAAVIGYLQQLNGIIPDILDKLSWHFLKFKNFRFEIINSHIKDRSAHKIAINFFSEPMIWHDAVSDHLLVSSVDGEKTEDGLLTHLLQLQPFLSIYSLKEEAI